MVHRLDDQRIALRPVVERRPDLKGRSLAAVKQILRREARASHKNELRMHWRLLVQELD